MKPSEEYLNQVRRSMVGMDPAMRDDILRELQSHVADATAANGGNVGTTLSQLGAPQVVGRRYRELYGYGRTFQLLFYAVGFLLAIPSVPVLSASTEGLFPFTFSLVFLAIVAGWTIWVSVAAGSRAGLGAGLAAFASRFLALGAAILVEPGTVVTAEGFVLFLATSAMVILLGWLPGTAKTVWSGPRAEL